MAYESLRPWLQVLEQQGMFKWVDKEVDKDWEIGSVFRMIFRGGERGPWRMCPARPRPRATKCHA